MRLAAVLAGKVVGLGGDMPAPSRSRANLRQPCTMFAFTPCDIATLATDAPGAAHCSSTNAFNFALCRQRKTTLSAAIVSTYLLDGNDHWRHALTIQGAAARRLLKPCSETSSTSCSRPVPSRSSRRVAARSCGCSCCITLKQVQSVRRRFAPRCRFPLNFSSNGSPNGLSGSFCGR